MKTKLALLTVASAALVLAPASALAQDNTWMSQDIDTLRGEVRQSYDAALAMTLDPAIVNANDPRYIWASEAKVQCGIAWGFLKSGTRDETSLSKCAMAYDMMMRPPVPRVAATPPVVANAAPPAPPPSQVCNRELPGLIFFEFDSAVPGSDAAETVTFVATNAEACDWNSFRVVGHADRAGSNAYNADLSRRRAEAVAELMTSRGIPRGAMTIAALGEESPRVPTADGVRELQNRRVEITVSQ